MNPVGISSAKDRAKTFFVLYGSLSLIFVSFLALPLTTWALTAGTSDPGTAVYPDGGMRVIGEASFDFHSQAGTLLIDEAAGYAYYVNKTVVEAKLAKLALGDGLAPPRLIGVIDFPTTDSQISCGVIDTESGYIYLGSSLYHQSLSQIIKVEAGSGDVLPTRVGSLVLDAGETPLTCAIFNPADTSAYFGAGGNQFKVIRALLEPQALPVRGGTAQIAGITSVGFALLDPHAGRGYFANTSGSAGVIRVILADPPAADSPKISLPDPLSSAAIDRAAGYAYFGSDESVIKVATGAGSDLPRLIGSTPVTSRIDVTLIDLVHNYLYLSQGAAIVRATAGAGDELPTLHGSLTLGQYALTKGAVSTTGDYAWLATQYGLIKVALRINQQGLLKATRLGIVETAIVDDVQFCSHAAEGNLRLAIFNDRQGTRSLVWDSGPFANTTAEGWISVPISQGTPSSLTLPPGTYWLAWQTDSAAPISSLVAGGAGDGVSLAQPFGPFPPTLPTGTAASTSDRWSMFLNYSAALPTPQPTPIPPVTGTPLPTPAAEQMELLGGFGGKLTAIGKQDNLLFIGEGRQMTAVDITNPERPAIMSRLPLTDLVRRIVVSGPFVYAALGDHGLAIIDESDPAHPRSRGTYQAGSAIIGIAVRGAYLFLTPVNSPLQTLDISDPDDPKAVAEFSIQTINSTFPPFSMPIYVGGNFIFVNTRLIDATDPARLNFVTQIATGSLTLSGRYLYEIGNVDGFQALKVYELLDPYHPTLLGWIHLDGEVLDVQDHGTKVCIFTRKNGIIIVDVSNPFAPTIKHSQMDNLEFSAGYYDGADSLAFACTEDELIVYRTSMSSASHLVGAYGSSETNNFGRLAFPGPIVGVVTDGQNLVTSNSNAVWLFDLVDPHAPAELGHRSVPGGINQVAAETNLIIAATGNAGLQIVDDSDATSPVLRGSFSPPVTALDVAVSGSLALVAHSGGLALADLTNPSAPAARGTFAFDTPVSSASVTASGSLAAVGDGSTRVRLLDFANPDAPEFLGSYQGVNSIAGSTFGDGRLLAGTNLLELADVSNPAEPFFLGQYAWGSGPGKKSSLAGTLAFAPWGILGIRVIETQGVFPLTIYPPDATPGPGGDVAISGDIACVLATDGATLWTYDLSDPVNPAPLGSLAFEGDAYRVSVRGSVAYVTNGTAGLRIVDISTPSTPTLTATFATAGFAIDCALEGPYAYVAELGNGLEIVDISDPSQPVLAGSLDSLNIYAIGISDGIACIGRAGSLGSTMQVLDLSNPTAPVVVSSSFQISNYSTPQRIVMDGGIAYVAAASRLDFSGNGVAVFDLTDPTRPKKRGFNITPGYAVGLALSGPRLFISIWGTSNKLQTLDVSNPAFPALTGTYNLAGANVNDAVGGIALLGESAYIGAGTGGFQVADISAWVPPARRGLYSDGMSTVQAVAVKNSTVYCASGDSGLLILNYLGDALPMEARVRDALLNEVPSLAGLDLNGDGRVDVADLIFGLMPRL